MVDTHRNLGAEKLKYLSQERLKYLGVGKEDERMYTGNYLKRVCVQLYRS